VLCCVIAKQLNYSVMHCFQCYSIILCLSFIVMQRNVFGESAWTYNDIRQQYYYHAYSVDEPDLNLTNPAVVAELDVSLLTLLFKTFTAD